MLKKIGSAFLILVCLIVFNWWNVNRSEKKDKLKQDDALLLAIDKALISKLETYNADSTWTLIKRVKKNDVYADAFSNFSQEFNFEPEWIVSWNSKKYLADQIAVDLLLNELTQAKKEKFITKDKNKFLDYGIGRQKSEIKIFKDTKVLHTLVTGDLNVSGKQLYVAKNNENAFLSSQELKKTQTETAQAYVYKNIVGLKHVEKIIFKNAKGKFELNKKDGQWQIVKPINISADQLAAESLVNQLENYTIDKVLDNELSEVVKNSLLKKAEIQFEISNKDKSMKTLYFNQGKPKGGKNTQPHSYIYREGLPFVFQKKSELPSSFYYELSDLVIKNVFSIQDKDIDSVIIKKDGKEKTLKKNGDQWEIAENTTASKANVFEPSDAMFNLKAKKFLDLGKNKSLAVDYAISIKNKAGDVQDLLVYQKPYQHHNLTFTQAYSSAFDTHIAFDKDQIQPISSAVNRMMNEKNEEFPK